MTTTEVLEPPADDMPPADPAERPVHLARCPFVDCPAGVKYQLTASGHGAIYLARYGFDDDTFVGLNERKVPLCPFGHGEMELADEQVAEPVSAADAISQVAEVTERQMQLLPSPPFNYEGCLHDLYKKSHEIATLKKKVEDRKESLKIAKDDFDHANEELGKMIAVFEEREHQRNDEITRQQLQKANGHPDGTTLIRCIWEERHSGEACPLCHNDGLDPKDAEVFVGLNPAPPDAVGHLDDVERYLYESDLVETLETIEPHITMAASEVKTWTREQRAEARAWAAAIEAFDGGGDRFPDLPKVIGRPHVASIVVKDEAQCCIQCDQILRTGGEGATYHEEGRRVGTNCKGKPPEAHRYPKTDKPKKTRKRSAKA